MYQKQLKKKILIFLSEDQRLSLTLSCIFWVSTSIVCQFTAFSVAYTKHSTIILNQITQAKYAIFKGFRWLLNLCTLCTFLYIRKEPISWADKSLLVISISSLKLKKIICTNGYSILLKIKQSDCVANQTIDWDSIISVISTNEDWDMN